MLDVSTVVLILYALFESEHGGLVPPVYMRRKVAQICFTPVLTFSLRTRFGIGRKRPLESRTWHVGDYVFHTTTSKKTCTKAGGVLSLRHIQPIFRLLS